MKNHENCTHAGKKDLTHGQGKIRNYFCPDCKMHWYRGRTWTEKEWNEFVEDFSPNHTKYFKTTKTVIIEGFRCKTAPIRKELRDLGESITFNDGTTYSGSLPLPIHWTGINDDIFEVYFKGTWHEAQALDFDFA